VAVASAGPYARLHLAADRKPHRSVFYRLDALPAAQPTPSKHWRQLLFIYYRLFTLAQTKTSSNCCTAALAVYLLLFSASYYLHSPSTASGARYRTSACIDIDMFRLAAAACCDKA